MDEEQNCLSKRMIAKERVPVRVEFMMNLGLRANLIERTDSMMTFMIR